MTISEENRQYSEFEAKGKAILPRVAVMSKVHWRHEGRPTAEQWYSQLNNPSGESRPTRGDSMETNTATANATTAPAATEPKAPRPKGAKLLIRELYTDESTALTIDEMAAATGKQNGSLQTAISDLKSSKYCAPGDPLVLNKWSDGKYRLAEEPKPEPAQQELATPAAVPADALPE